MKKIFGMFVLGLALTAQAKAQPTKSQCDADTSAWFQTYKADKAQLGFQTLADRANEMGSCSTTYMLMKDDGDEETATILLSVYEEEMTNRLGHFVNRENHYARFLSEDQKGYR
ncbi:MAG: hypothetical protein ACRD8A_18985 [Candidatus Acidiferrales bacterium]